VSLVLKQSFDLLDKIDINDLSNEESDKQLDLIKQINSLSFEMKKKLGKSFALLDFFSLKN
jgi:hypothetical protein